MKHHKLRSLEKEVRRVERLLRHHWSDRAKMYNQACEVREESYVGEISVASTKSGSETSAVSGIAKLSVCGVHISVCEVVGGRESHRVDARDGEKRGAGGAVNSSFSLSAMASRTASPLDSQRVSALVQDPSFNAEPMSDKISAYYSLVFPNFTYYLQTLNVTIGRRCIPTSTASSSDQTQVDVDLGPLKSVSRLHARIEYEEEEERFVLAVLGRNGAWVDGTWCGKGNKVPLSERYIPSCLHVCLVLLTHAQFADPDSLAHVPLCAATPASS
jgi:FHA domain